MRDFPGGLFHPSDDKQEVAFRYAAEKINANRDILPKSRLSAQVEVIQPQDSFHASKRGEFHNRIRNTRLRKISSRARSLARSFRISSDARSIIFCDLRRPERGFALLGCRFSAQYFISHFNPDSFVNTLFFVKHTDYCLVSFILVHWLPGAFEIYLCLERNKRSAVRKILRHRSIPCLLQTSNFL